MNFALCIYNECILSFDSYSYRINLYVQYTFYPKVVIRIICKSQICMLVHSTQLNIEFIQNRNALHPNEHFRVTSRHEVPRPRLNPPRFTIRHNDNNKLTTSITEHVRPAFTSTEDDRRSFVALYSDSMRIHCVVCTFENHSVDRHCTMQINVIDTNAIRWRYCAKRICVYRIPVTHRLNNRSAVQHAWFGSILPANCSYLHVRWLRTTAHPTIYKMRNKSLRLEFAFERSPVFACDCVFVFCVSCIVATCRRTWF